jgi:hypothetical protein
MLLHHVGDQSKVAVHGGERLARLLVEVSIEVSACQVVLPRVKNPTGLKRVDVMVLPWILPLLRNNLLALILVGHQR